MRDTRNKMVGDVVVGNVVEEETASPTEEGSIDGGDSATYERPRVLAEVRHRRVGMVKIGEHHDPVVREQVGYGIVLDDRREVSQINRVPHNSGHDPEPNIGSDNLPEVLFFKERRIWREVLCRWRRNDQEKEE
jgi:hypothetical protein